MISFFITSLVMAQAVPVPRVGSSCPLGFYVSSGYCVPSAGNKNQWAIQKEGPSCPFGSYPSGSYCVKSYGR